MERSALFWHRLATVAGACESGTENVDFIKCGESFEQMKNSQLLKKVSPPQRQLFSS
jgi:hypothetical protein